EGDLLAMFESAGSEAAVNAETEESVGKDTASSPRGEEEKGGADTADAASAPAADTASAPRTIEVCVPDIGEDGEVDVIEVLVSEGDEISAEDGLITLETDKATMDVPSPEAGVVKSVEVKVGDKVKQGSLVIKLETAGEPVSDAAQAGADTQSQGSADAEKSPAKADSAESAKSEDKSA